MYNLAQEDIERPRILEKPQSVMVNEGDTIRLEVFAVGHPTPEIAWLKDNVLLTQDKYPDLRLFTFLIIIICMSFYGKRTP